MTDVKREQIRKLDDLFRDRLFRPLLDEGFQPTQANLVFDACRTVEYAATADRPSRLGNERLQWLGQAYFKHSGYAAR